MDTGVRITSNRNLDEIKEKFGEEIVNHINNLLKDDSSEIWLHRTPQKDIESFFKDGLFVNSDNINFTATKVEQNVESILRELDGAEEYKDSNNIFLIKLPKSGLEYVKGKTEPILYTDGNSNHLNPKYIDSVINLEDKTLIHRLKYMSKNNIAEKEISEEAKKYNFSIFTSYKQNNPKELANSYNDVKKEIENYFPELKLPKKMELSDIMSRFSFSKPLENSFKELGKKRLEEIEKKFNAKLTDYPELGNDGVYSLIAMINNHTDVQNMDKTLNELHLDSKLFMENKSIELTQKALGVNELQNKLNSKSLAEYIIKYNLEKEAAIQNNALVEYPKQGIFAKLKNFFTKKDKKQTNISDTKVQNEIIPKDDGMYSYLKQETWPPEHIEALEIDNNDEIVVDEQYL